MSLDRYPDWLKEVLDWKYKEDPVLPICYLCDNIAQYRYACYDFGDNWSEWERWRCQEYGHQHHGDYEWDFFEPWDFN